MAYIYEWPAVGIIVGPGTVAAIATVWIVHIRRRRRASASTDDRPADDA